MLERLQQAFELTPLSASAPGETAERWAYDNGAGEIGLISSVTQAFCGDCNRARLSTDGRLYTCLFAHRGHDLRAALRSGEASDERLAGLIGQVWQGRSDRYSQQRADSTSGPTPAAERRVEMHYIGG